MTTPIYAGTFMPLIAARPLLALAGRGGYTLDLVPGAEAKQYSWEPEEWLDVPGRGKAPAGDLDLQMMWIKATPPANNPPLVWWRIEYGHGETVYSVPQHSPLTASGVAGAFRANHGWMLPGRGLRLRLPGRALKIFFSTPAESPPPPDNEIGGAPCTIQVSVQPCAGMETQLLPLTDGGFGQGAPPVFPQQFPLGATEMRFNDPSTGLEFAAAETVQFFDICGTALGAPVQLAMLGLWHPIPIFAAFWLSTSAAAQVSYR